MRNSDRVGPGDSYDSKGDILNVETIPWKQFLSPPNNPADLNLELQPNLLLLEELYNQQTPQSQSLSYSSSTT